MSNWEELKKNKLKILYRWYWQNKDGINYNVGNNEKRRKNKTIANELGYKKFDSKVRRILNRFNAYCEENKIIGNYHTFSKAKKEGHI